MIFVHALGTAQIDAGTARVKPTSVRRFALLLYLAAETGRRVSRSTLHELICPDQAEKNARHTLRELLYQLRQSDVPVLADFHGVELPADAVQSDYARLIGQEWPTDDSLRALEGGFLPGYMPTNSEAFVEWYEGFRAKTLFELCKFLRRTITSAKAGGDWTTTERAARACLALDPMNEEATLALAEMLALAGSKIQAVELLDSYMKEANDHSTDLRLPASALRARIQEHAPPEYSGGIAMPFIGRSREMLLLNSAFLQAQAGSTRLVVITGEAGMGKTRLLEEFAAIVRLQGTTVQRVCASSHDVRRPMAAFVDLVPALLRTPGALGCSPTSLTTLSRLTSHLDSDAQFQAPLDVHSLSYSIGRALEDLLDALSHENRLVVLIEDAHWLDHHSVEAVGDIARRTYGSGLMVVVTSRDRHQLDKIGRELDNAVLLSLPGLEAHDAATLSTAVLPGSDASVLKMRDWISEKSAGNPLFIRALSAHYRSTGRQFEIPASLLDLLRRRIESVSTKAKTALSACGALGRWCSLERFARVLEMPHADLVAAAAELQDAELVRATPDGLAVAHPMIAQALQDNSGAIGTRLTHRQIAQVLEAEPSFAASPSMIWDCSQHWLSAGYQARALTLLKMCASHAVEIGRPREGAQMLLQAASLTEERAERTALLRKAALTASLGSEYDFVLECTTELRAIERLSRHDDLELCELEAFAGNNAEAAQFQDRALSCLRSLESSIEHRVRAGLMILKFADVLAEPFLLEAVQQAVSPEDLAAVAPRIRLEYMLVHHSAVGNHSVAAEVAREICRVPPDGLTRMERAKLLYNAGLALWFSGHARESIETLQTAQRAATDCGAVRLRLLAGLQLSGCLLDIGEAGRARELFREVETFASSVSGKQWPFELALVRVDMALSRNDGAEAARCLEDAEAQEYYNVTQRQIWYRTFQRRLRHLGFGKPLTDNDITELLRQKGTRSQVFGPRDTEIATAIEHLSRKDPARSRRVAEDYLLSERHCLAPLGAILQEALRATGCDDLLHDWPLQRLANAHA